jgi:hypothetical protein
LQIADAALIPGCYDRSMPDYPESVDMSDAQNLAFLPELVAGT